MDMDETETLGNDKDVDSVTSSIDLICRQTDYTNEEAKAMLDKYNGDCESVLNEYLGIPQKIKENPSSSNRSTNQEIYSQIRLVMDDASKRYRESKGLQELENKRLLDIQDKSGQSSDDVIPEEEKELLTPSEK